MSGHFVEGFFTDHAGEFIQTFLNVGRWDSDIPRCFRGIRLARKLAFFHSRNAQKLNAFKRRRTVAKKAKAVPRGYRTVTPYLIIKDAASAIDYYKQAFKAKVLMCLSEPNGKVGHAEIKIGDSRIMVADEYPETGSRGPHSLGGITVSIVSYLET